MAWTNINLNDVSTQPELIPAGKYTFELSPGAKFDEKGNLRVSATIVEGGEFTGRRVFFSYPDPESLSRNGKMNTWSAQAFKRFTQALGVDPNDGEPFDVYLNRASGTRFTTSLTHTKPTDEYPNPSVNVNLFNVSPAA